MATTDSNRIVFLEETDAMSPFQTTINTLQTATSTAITGLKTSIAVPIIKGYTVGPSSSQTYNTTTVIVISNTVTCTADHAYEVTASFTGTQNTSSGVVTIRLAGSSLVPTNIGYLETASAGKTVYGTVSGLYLAATTASKAFQLTAATSAGTLTIAANAATIWIKDLGTY